MKILDIVKFNSGVTFVVDKMPVLTYEKMTAPVSACKGEYEKFVFAWREFLEERMGGMERLTKHYTNATLGVFMACAANCINEDFDCNGCVKLDEIVARLAAYEDTGLTPEEIIEFLHQSNGPLHKKLGQWLQAEQEGRLAVLPCKVGDTIYVIPPHGRITETTVRTFFFGHPSHRIEAREMRMIRTINWDIPMDEFGKRIFLPREEAEAALAEMAKEARK